MSAQNAAMVMDERAVVYMIFTPRRRWFREVNGYTLRSFCVHPDQLRHTG